jgi:acyl-CoA synthetase (AMP-forming)/AMP-acid ligase II
MTLTVDGFSIPFLKGVEPNDRIFVDDQTDAWMSTSTFAAMANEWHERCTGPKKLVFIYIRNTIPHVAAFLGLLRAGHSVALLDPDMMLSRRNEVEKNYEPELIVNPWGITDDEIGSVAVQIKNSDKSQLHPMLSVLLSTSGSTGSPKFVRLSMNNLMTNAEAISQVLDIRHDEVGLGHLPLHYSYGLSVLTSHLVQGAPVLLTEHGFMDRAFWTKAKAMEAAHLPGVPFHYQTLRRLGLNRIDMPALRVMTQAGGRLDVPTSQLMHDYMSKRNGRFHVMYGQTEASPRITTLSHEDYKLYPESVGTALPGGKLDILGVSDLPIPCGQDGEVVYKGSNVMLGYAETREELCLGDTQKGVLRTGDIGRLDTEGRLTLTSRIKRFAKIAGLRVGLDDVERVATLAAGEAATLQIGDYIMIYCIKSEHSDTIKTKVLDLLLDHFTIPKIAYRVLFVDSIPRTERGKINYSALETEA